MNTICSLVYNLNQNLIRHFSITTELINLKVCLLYWASSHSNLPGAIQLEIPICSSLIYRVACLCFRLKLSINYLILVSILMDVRFKQYLVKENISSITCMYNPCNSPYTYITFKSL